MSIAINTANAGTNSTIVGRGWLTQNVNGVNNDGLTQHWLFKRERIVPLPTPLFLSTVGLVGIFAGRRRR